MRAGVAVTPRPGFHAVRTRPTDGSTKASAVDVGTTMYPRANIGARPALLPLPFDDLSERSSVHSARPSFVSTADRAPSPAVKSTLPRNSSEVTPGRTDVQRTSPVFASRA